MSVCTFKPIFHALISVITLSRLSDILYVPDLAFSLRSTGRECHPFSSYFFCVLTSASLYRLQEVSARRPVCFFQCPDKSFPLPSQGSECASVGLFLSVS